MPPAKIRHRHVAAIVTDRGPSCRLVHVPKTVNIFVRVVIRFIRIRRICRDIYVSSAVSCRKRSVNIAAILRATNTVSMYMSRPNIPNIIPVKSYKIRLVIKLGRLVLRSFSEGTH